MYIDMFLTNRLYLLCGISLKLVRDKQHTNYLYSREYQRREQTPLFMDTNPRLLTSTELKKSLSKYTKVDHITSEKVKNYCSFYIMSRFGRMEASRQRTQP